MFKGFIVLGVAYVVGYTQGYISGQNHTEELKDLVHDLRDSEETKQWFVDLLVAVKEVAAKAETEEETSEGSETAEVAEAVEVIPDPDAPIKPVIEEE